MPAPRRGDVLIRGGLLATGQGIQRADILVRNGKVARVAEELSDARARRVINASGKYILPGVVDAHQHPVYADKMDTASLSAAFGGITTLIPFVGNIRAWGFQGRTSECIKGFIEEAGRTSYLDFGVHGAFVADDDVAQELPKLVQMGVISFKCFMTYPRRGMMMPDAKLLQIMALAADLGAITMVHAENGYGIDYLVDYFTSRGLTDKEFFALSQPNLVEAEAVFRACTYASLTGCPLYLVHLSAHEVIDLLLDFKDRGVQVYGETCPQYLTLTNEAVLEQGALAKIGPPLRGEEDNEAMWAGLVLGALDAIGSDACGYTREEKMRLAGPMRTDEAPPARNIFEARFGAPGAEQMLPVVYHHGVNRGRLTLPRLVQVLCENPAKLFGLYPRKGALRPGSDADLVVFDPSVRHTLGAATQHCKADYTLYEGWEVLGAPVLVMQRGEPVVEEGRLVRPQGHAQFLPGDPERAAYAPRGHAV